MANLPVVKPKHEMTEREHRLRQAFAMVREELMLDGGPRRNLTPPMAAKVESSGTNMTKH